MLSFLLSVTDEEYRPLIERMYHLAHLDALRLAKARFTSASFPDPEAYAEDAVQGAFLRLTKYADGIRRDASDEQLLAYVLSTVANEALRIMKQTHFTAPLDDNEPTPSDESFLEQLCIKERYDAVVAAIKALDEKYAVVLLWCFGEEKSVKEIAALLGVSAKTVYTRLARGKRILLEKCQREGLTDD